MEATLNGLSSIIKMEFVCVCVCIYVCVYAYIFENLKKKNIKISQTFPVKGNKGLRELGF